MHPIHRFLLARRRAEIIVLALGIGVLLAFLDWATGSVVAFAAFYLIPVTICAAYAGRFAGVAAGLLATVTWALANRLAGEVLSLPVTLWNASTRLVFFLVVAWLVSELRLTLQRLHDALRREQQLSRIDALTGARNAQGFREAAALELQRASRYRHPMAVVFIDLDDFKLVNDRHGHAAGDEVLRLVGDYLRSTLRQTDTVARLGGDEFALLLPETDEASSEQLLHRIRHHLAVELARRNWPVTLSAGAVVVVPRGETVDWLLNEADRLMYAVKVAGKNGLKIQALRSA